MGDDGAAPADPAPRARVYTQDTAALRHALTGLAGASIEWYDFFLYATASALVFPTIFFPANLPPSVALLASFSTFAVGFLMRPVGAVFFGHLGDRRGRKVAFAVALIMMGAATALIGLLPSYHIAGIFSPLALVLLRLAQGVAVGGQWGGAILLATENASNSKRGLYGSIAQAGVPVGVLLANLSFVAAGGAMSNGAFMAYGWRIPFLFSLALVGLGIFVQLRIDDTAAFRQLGQSIPPTNDHPEGNAGLDAPVCATKSMRGGRSPVLEALRLYPKLILLAGGAYVSTILAFYILITYVVSYGTSAAGLHLARSTMLTAVMMGSLAHVPVIFLAGMWSDRYGRRRIFMTGVAMTGVWAFILFPLIDTRSFGCIALAIGVGMFFLSLTAGPMAAMFAEQFITRVRYSAVSLAYQLGAIVGGGLAPVIATGLYARFHSNTSVSLYIAGACVVSLVCASKLKEAHETRRFTSSDIDEPPR
jgi:MFS family permease